MYRGRLLGRRRPSLRQGQTSSRRPLPIHEKVFVRSTPLLASDGYRRSSVSLEMARVFPFDQLLENGKKRKIATLIYCQSTTTVLALLSNRDLNNGTIDNTRERRGREIGVDLCYDYNELWAMNGEKTLDIIWCTTPTAFIIKLSGARFFFFVCSFHINRIQRQWWGTEVSTAGISGSFFFLVYTFRIGRCHAELGAVAARLRPTSRQSILITTKKTPPFSSAIPVVTRVIYAPIPKGENIHLGITSSLANVWILKWKKRRRKKYVNSKGSITLRGVCVCSFAWIQHGRYRYWLKRFFFLFWTPGMPVWQMCVSIQRYTIQQSSPPPLPFFVSLKNFSLEQLAFWRASYTSTESSKFSTFDSYFMISIQGPAAM